MSGRGSLQASHTAAFNLRVVKYAVKHGNHAAGKKFVVDKYAFAGGEFRGKSWLKHRSWNANRCGVLALPDLEKELACWIKEKHQGGFRVSTNVICLKAKSGMQEGNSGFWKVGVTVLWYDVDSRTLHHCGPEASERPRENNMTWNWDTRPDTFWHLTLWQTAL